MTGFELEDLIVGNGTVSELQGDNASYTATVTPTASGTVTVDIATGAAQDAAGNPTARGRPVLHHRGPDRVVCGKGAKSYVKRFAVPDGRRLASGISVVSLPVLHGRADDRAPRKLNRKSIPVIHH